MRYTLLLITDGRDDYLTRTLTSALVNLPAPERVVLVDDRAHILGFAGEIQHGWAQILATDAEFIFHLEADFTFNQPVPLDDMAHLLEDPRIVQVALKRQAWSPEEVAAGGLVEAVPAAFEERDEHGVVHTVTRRCFTTNPCLYRREIAERGWPQEPESEGKFGIKLFNEDFEAVSCFLGGKFDPPMVHHIGDERAGLGY